MDRLPMASVASSISWIAPFDQRGRVSARPERWPRVAVELAWCKDVKRQMQQAPGHTVGVVGPEAVRQQARLGVGQLGARWLQGVPPDGALAGVGSTGRRVAGHARTSKCPPRPCIGSAAPRPRRRASIPRRRRRVSGRRRACRSVVAYAARPCRPSGPGCAVNCRGSSPDRCTAYTRRQLPNSAASSTGGPTVESKSMAIS